jgi:hypothetical protein
MRSATGSAGWPAMSRLRGTGSYVTVPGGPPATARAAGGIALGVKEEFVLLDPSTGAAASSSTRSPCAGSPGTRLTPDWPEPGNGCRATCSAATAYTDCSVTRPRTPLIPASATSGLGGIR